MKHVGQVTSFIIQCL